MVLGAVATFLVLVSFNPVALDALFGETVAETGPDPGSELQFVDVAAQRGFAYEADLHDQEVTWAGVYAADVDHDGFEDLLAVGGEKPVLFVNRDGRYVEQRTFEHPAARSAHFFDSDADGDEDLLILSRGERPAFYENVGGAFERRDVGFDRPLEMPYGAASADFTGDGTLDLFVYQNGEWQAASPLSDDEARRVYDNHPDVRPETDTGARNYLYVNEGGEFVDRSDELGFEEYDWSLAASAIDLTGNGHPDIHVTNDFTRDYLYVNHGNGNFEQVDFGPRSDRNGMASEVTDVNRDGHPDLYVTNIWFDNDTMVNQANRALYKLAPVHDGHNLYVNDGSGTFTDEGDAYGVVRTGWGWSSVFADFTNSGLQDLVHATSADRPWKGYRPFERMQAFVRHDERFERLDANGTGFKHEGTRGIVPVDFDADGTLDIAAATTGGAFNPDTRTPYRLYDNRLDSDAAVQFWVRDPDGLDRGAEIAIELSDGRTVYRFNNGKTDFLSQESGLHHVGTENADVEAVRVTWPDGRERTYTDLASGSRYLITPAGVDHITKFR